MAPPRKKDPEIHCSNCGVLLVRKRLPCGDLDTHSKFVNRKFCSRPCSAARFKGVERGRVGEDSCRRWARNRRCGTTCVVCGRVGRMDTHHRDGDYKNNDLDNLMVVCRACHMRLHHPVVCCKLCEKRAVARGLCNTHWHAWRKCNKLAEG